MQLYFARNRQSRNRQTKRNKNKYTATEMTIPVTLRIHKAIGMIRQQTELFQWLRIYITDYRRMCTQ